VSDASILRRSATGWILAGLAIMTVSEAATVAGIEPFASWNTPIAWTGFIIFADSIVYRARGDSWLRSSPREFVWLAIASVPLWIVFEGYNLVINNWYYTGLPENFWLRQLGYMWSFATIWPAIFEGAELVAVIRTGSKRSDESLDDSPRSPRSSASTASRGSNLVNLAIGAAMLAAPFVAPASIAPYLAAPVWLGFIFLLDPVNRRLGAEGLTYDRAINLAWSGLLCGVLWEFWNYWARAKWHYSVPIMEHTKIFEMPLPGYLGFPAFALECFTMYVFVRAALLPLSAAGPDRPGRRIAL
jgi:hypothetical protein